MDRLTERLKNGVINVKYASQHETAIHRLVTIEDILGDVYNLDRLREIVEADNDKRCVIFEKGYGIVSLYKKDDEGFVTRTVCGVVPESELVMKHFIRKEEQA